MMAESQFLILVDENDVPIGKIEKLEAHRQALLHRAFSVFLFNENGALLMQQRAASKYHSANLWTNTCCSHPEYGETLEVAVKRRLFEEMGIEAELEFAFSFLYKATFENGLTEHEFDHVYFGICNELPTPNPKEVQRWEYLSLDALELSLKERPEQFTAWLQICFDRVKQHFYNYKLKNEELFHN